MSLLKVKNSFAAFGALCTLLMAPFIVKSQGPVPPPTLQGKSFDVLLIPNNTVNAGEIFFRRDSDNDGMTDEDEAQNGTNPNDPSDADGDLDGDGVTNGDEVEKGTNPNSVDSDGDGVSDGEEIRLGYNPLDPNDTPPPNTTIVSLEVTPSPFVLIVNTIFGTAPVQLTVTGITNTGTTVDLTNNPNTVYQSLNQAVAAVGATGSVFGVSAGSTTIRVQNGTLTADASANVIAFAPAALSALQIPGYANNVDVAGNYAYVAAGAAGLQVVNISDRASPQIVASLDTPGNANDIRVVNGFAYVADGISGLQVINVANPLNPVSAGSFDTPGEANDVVVVGTTAYIADGLSGLQIIDVTSPATPQLIGSIDTAGKTRGVDVSGNYAVLAEGTPSSAVRVVNITNPAAPQIVGTLFQAQEVIDLTVRDNFAYVAGWMNGLRIVDFTNPAVPAVTSSFDVNVFQPRDVALTGNTLFAAETVQANPFVPFFNVGLPSVLNYRGGIDLGNIGFEDGTGIAVDDQFVYLTGGFAQSAEKGVDNGLSYLVVSRYQTPNYNGAVPPQPVVNITSPAEGTQLIQGQTVRLAASVADEWLISQLTFSVNGVETAIFQSVPFEQSFTVPTGIDSLNLEVIAVDRLGRTTTATRTVAVVPDPLTTVTGRVLDGPDVPASGLDVTVFGEFTAQTGADGTFALTGIPTVRGNINLSVTGTLNGREINFSPAPLPPVVGAVTDFGDVHLTTIYSLTLPDIPVALGQADFNRDQRADVFFGFNTGTPSAIYAANQNGQLGHDANISLPFNLVNAGTVLRRSDFNDSGDPHVIAQLPGQPGTLTSVHFSFTGMEPAVQLASGLTGESEFVAAGRDKYYPPQAFLAFLKVTGGTELTVRFSDGFGNDVFGPPVNLPVDPTANLRSPQMADVNGDGLVDLVLIKQLSGNGGRLVVYNRTSATTFGPPIELPIILRNRTPVKQTMDYAVGNFVGDYTTGEIAVLGDSSVRVYQQDSNGIFAVIREYQLPMGNIPLGIASREMPSGDSLAVSVASSTSPQSRSMLLYLQGSTGELQAPQIYRYTGPTELRDARIILTYLNDPNCFLKADVVVVDGSNVTSFMDVGPEWTNCSLAEVHKLSY
ncbi:MAG: Ig-like domain-containing protein [Pyrinomonadaceae bacterium]